MCKQRMIVTGTLFSVQEHSTCYFTAQWLVDSFLHSTVAPRIAIMLRSAENDGIYLLKAYEYVW